MDANKKKIMILSFILMIPRGTVCKKGRLKNLLNRLEKEATRELFRTLPISKKEFHKLKEKVVQLQDLIGWKGGKKHPMTIVSFALQILDDYKFEKIIEILNDITEYFERVGKLYPACNWSGCKAAEKLEEIAASKNN